MNKDGLTVYKPCKCAEMRKIEKIWHNSGIKVDDLDKSFKSFESWNRTSQSMKDMATNYYLRFKNIKETLRNSIMFCGNPGCGKTHLALALANNFLKKDNLKVVYMPYRDIITSLKQNMLDEEYYQKTLAKYKNADILLVDDLFKGKVNETDINITFEIVNHRYINKLPMIISTEYTVERLLNFDEAVGSRIYEMCKDFLIEVKGTENNYRLR